MLIARATTIDRAKFVIISERSDLPKACAVTPVVPIRRKPKFQYKKLNSMAPRPTAPRCTEDKWPIKAVSTELMSGTEILLKILGPASLKISRFIFRCAFMGEQR